jgi:hypothetical protein
MPLPTEQQAQHHLNRLRQARAAAMADAEGFTQILFAIEDLGALMKKRVMALGQYRDPLRELAARSPLSWEGAESPNTKRFEWLFSLVKDVRNEAMHQGASARHATDRCVDLCLMLEDALTTFKTNAGHVMVTGVAEAKLHETVSAVRGTMLSQSFSYLPVSIRGTWMLVTDREVARFLRRDDDRCPRAVRLAMPLSTALGLPTESRDVPPPATPMEIVEPAAYVSTEAELGMVLDRIDHRPVLVTGDGSDKGVLVGIVTSFDLL